VTAKSPGSGDTRYYEDDYEYYQRLFDPTWTDRRARPRRKPKSRHVPKVAEESVVAQLGDAVGLEQGFQTTYSPGRHEEGWLLESLRTFYDEALITDVFSLIKGGKEASVYLCRAHPSMSVEWVAAKVYRPRRFRNLRNDKAYRQGRDVLTADGRPVKKTDHRVMRAIGKKTAFGVQVSHTSWLMHEYKALETLYQCGGNVPRPYAVSENAILMGYRGSIRMAAPTLDQIRLPVGEAELLFAAVLYNVELMLRHRMIHGDLSAYNILYWDGEITIIDFPQAVSLDANREAGFILERDIMRLCEYFARQGVELDARGLRDDLWSRYGATEMPDPWDVGEGLELM